MSKHASSQYEINWATGGRALVEAASVEEAHAAAREFLPPGGDWVDLDLTKVPD